MSCPNCGSRDAEKLGSNVRDCGTKVDGYECNECGEEWGDVGI